MIKEYLNEKRALVEEAMKQMMLAEEGPFADHIKAMRYSLFAGGKRVRPILCLAGAAAVNDDPQLEKALLATAVALECIHTYSLIHDDLPCMDDDELRRGKPTSHVLFGEAQALLAGDGLLTYAFELLSAPQSGLSLKAQLGIVATISKAAGSIGMVGGQSLDIAYENQEYPIETLQTIHRHKTGALITAAVISGAIAAEASSKQLEHLTAYGKEIGLAFQIVDDLLNATSTTEQLGKAAGSDAERGKATYPHYYGIEKTRELAKAATERAITSLESFDKEAQPLRALAEYIYARTH